MVRGVPSYCPYCGAELATRRFEGRDRGYCPDCERFVWRDPAPGAAVGVVDPDEGVLLQKRAVPPDEGTWGFPGGHLDVDEQPRAGAARELREETGLRVAPGDLTIVDAVTYSGAEAPVLSLLFVAPRSVVEGSIDPGSEASDAQFFTPAAFARTGETMPDRFRPTFERLAAIDP